MYLYYANHHAFTDARVSELRSTAARPRRSHVTRTTRIIRAIMLLGAVAAGLTCAWPAHALAVDPSEVTLTILGSGSVTLSPVDQEASTCVAPLSTPSGTVGKTCTFTTSGGFPFGFPGFWVRLTAVAPSGWTVDGWTGAELCETSATTCRMLLVGDPCARTCGFLKPSVSVSFKDLTAPETQIDARPAGTVAGGRATIAFHSSESATFECRLDSAGFAPCVSPLALSQLGDGPHTAQVRAVDPSGNRDSTPATASWTVDTTPPETRFDSGPDEQGFTNARRATFALGSEPDTHFECALDGPAFGPCPALVSFSELGLGVHTLSARAIDAVGNTDPTPAIRHWSITADLDHDGFILGHDCDDTNPTVHPGSHDIPQDGIDQDCSGVDAPFPALRARVSISVAFLHAATRISRLTITKLPAGADVLVTCQRGRGSCPFRRHTLHPRRVRHTLALTTLFAAAPLHTKALVAVTITKPQRLGLFTRFELRNGRLPRRREHCLDPRTGRRAPC